MRVDHLEEHAQACIEMMQAMGHMAGMMGGMGMSGMGMDGMMGGMGAATWLLWAVLVPLALLALLVAATIFLVRASRRSAAHDPGARAVADSRYARGELSREEYLAIRHDLEARAGTD